MKHTDGPWKTRGGCNEMLIDAPGHVTCLAVVNMCVNNPERAGEMSANALLIAAAPELLDALTGLLNWGRDHLSPVHNPEAHELLVAAHNAIAKATGTK